MTKWNMTRGIFYDLINYFDSYRLLFSKQMLAFYPFLSLLWVKQAFNLGLQFEFLRHFEPFEHSQRLWLRVRTVIYRVAHLWSELLKFSFFTFNLFKKFRWWSVCIRFGGSCTIIFWIRNLLKCSKFELFLII